MRLLVLLAIVIGASSGAPPQRAMAQGAHGASVDLLPGARVRVTSPATGRIVGTLLGASDDSVRVELAGGSSVALPTRGLSELEVSGGVRRNGWRGAGIGLLVGAGVGGAIGLATYRRSECYDNAIEGFFCDIVNRTSRSVTVVSDAAMVGTAGAIVGALIGHAGREAWVRVPIRRASARVGLVGHTGVGVAIAM